VRDRAGWHAHHGCERSHRVQPAVSHEVPGTARVVRENRRRREQDDAEGGETALLDTASRAIPFARRLSRTFPLASLHPPCASLSRWTRD
jgi:hypothetical protein